MAYYRTVQYEKVVTYTIPLTSGEYAPEVHHVKAQGQRDVFHILKAMLEAALPTGAVIELWFLKHGPEFTEDHADVTNYIFGRTLLSGATLSTVETPYVWHLEIRAKSGGTAGSATLHVTAI